MTNSTRDRIGAAFDRELAGSPVPPSLRAHAVHSAVVAPRPETHQPRLLALVAALLALALIATLVVASHLHQPKPIPAGSTVPPAPRAGAQVAYDQARGVLVVFGGNSTPPLNDTWTWDGKYWTHQRPATSPLPRHDGAMAYDAARRNVVLFGGMAQTSTNGKAGQAPVDDTWIWNGGSWQQRHPAHEPAFGFDRPATMEYDPISRTVLLFGFKRNSGFGGPYQSQTWSWNGSDWSQLNRSTMPADVGTLATDGHEIVLISGSASPIGGRYITQTWAWDGTNWNALTPKVNLPPVGTVSAAYDPQHGQLVALTSDTWTWDGSTWSRQHPKLQPMTVGYMAYMPSLHQVVSWGDRASTTDNEMFGWTGTDWTLIDPGTVQVPPSSGGKGYLGVMSPLDAANAVRSTVKNSRPVLLPSSLPGGPYDAVVNADVDGFDIQYESDLRDKTIAFGIVVANPPAGTNPSDRRVQFRGVSAEYYVRDVAAPTSGRWLSWNEPGTMANPQTKAPGVPYFLSTEGLTDAEFWQIANSLR